MLHAFLVALAMLAPTLAIAQASAVVGTPEIGIEASGSCRALTVRNRANGQRVSVGCLNTSTGKFRLETETASEGDVSTRAASTAFVKGLLGGKQRYVLPALVTTETSTGFSASVGEGAIDSVVTRTGGYGQYGAALFRYDVKAPLPVGQFDVGLTSWVTHRNLTGGQTFGAWLGANTPLNGADYGGSPAGQVWSGGAAIGAEINTGNRWGEFGLQSTIGGARYTAGLQVVPDVLPAFDGPTLGIYHGTFGLIVSQSVHGHKWWTGTLVPPDAIVAGGYTNRVHGGSTAPNAPAAFTRLDGHFSNGIDLANAAIPGNALGFADGQTVGVAGSGTLNLSGSLAASGDLTWGGAPWASYTPTVTASSGTIATLGAVSGAYTKLGKTVVVSVSFVITTNGTAADSLSVSLPPGVPSFGMSTAFFVEDVVTGQPSFGMIYGSATAVTAIRTATAGYPGGNGRRLSSTFIYRTN